MATPDETIGTLNSLIETCKDGEIGFRAAAGYLQEPALKRLFLTRSEDCRHATAELRAMVMAMGGPSEEPGRVASPVHRGWVAGHGSPSTYSAKAILEEAESGENAALARYRRALACRLTPAARNLVEQQLDGVKRIRTELRLLRDQDGAAHA